LDDAVADAFDLFQGSDDAIFGQSLEDELDAFGVVVERKDLLDLLVAIFDAENRIIVADAVG
jgi:hypothetical protein